MFGLIDSNSIKSNATGSIALSKLLELKADKISFIALTHPHRDHYSGLACVFEHFQHNIEYFYTFPITRYLDKGNLAKLANIYRDAYLKSGSENHKSAILELIKIFKYGTDFIKKENWQELTGHWSQVAPTGWQNVRIHALLPDPSIKGQYFNMIEKGDLQTISEPIINELSTAFSIQYADKEIILSGDGTSNAWLKHNQFTTRRGTPLNGQIVKLPHHGAKNDNTNKTLAHLFSDSNDCKAIISANGNNHHPDKATLKLLRERNFDIYCTNISNHCRNIRELGASRFTGIEPELARNLIAMEDSVKPAPCQGDIKVTISPEGKIDISTSNNIDCLHSSKFKFLFTELLNP